MVGGRPLAPEGGAVAVDTKSVGAGYPVSKKVPEGK